MLKRILAIVVLLYATTSFAALDINKATAAELDSIKGIGPSLSTKILDERDRGSFLDWSDLMHRVKGIGASNATRFSAQGLTVNGIAFNPGGSAAKNTPSQPATNTDAPHSAASAASQ